MPPRASSDEFERLALPLLPSLLRHARWLSRDEAEAEDLVQEALTKALRALASFEAGTNFKAWIFRILRNTFLTSRTAIAASRTVSLEDGPEPLETGDTAPSPEEQMLQMEREAAGHEALDRLHPRLREVLLLCDVEEMKYREIAMVLDLPIGTVMSRISRARRSLAYELEQPFRSSR